MPLFKVNAHRFDPYLGFKFRVKWDGVYVAGLSKCSALKRTTEAADWRSAGDPSHARRIPGKTSYDALTLEAGVTHDDTFEKWAESVNNFRGDPLMSLKNFRKDITIDIYNLQGAKVLSYNVFRCWVSEYQAVADLDTSSAAVLIQRIKLENEGWLRDTSVTEPSET
jgi:phage tail-like protein